MATVRSGCASAGGSGLAVAGPTGALTATGKFPACVDSIKRANPRSRTAPPHLGRQPQDAPVANQDRLLHVDRDVNDPVNSRTI